MKTQRGRWARVLPLSGGYYVHVMSRVVDGRHVLGEEEKQYFLGLLRGLSSFTGIGVVTYALLDNHFHLLLRVEEAGELSEAELLGRLSGIYDRRALGEIRDRLERFRGYSSEAAYQSERAKYEERMGDLGMFMKTLKQQFTRWYNRRHDRRGTLWEARYKSVVVEGAEAPLLTMATYIDLNAVRAGLVSDPKDYRWCGYGEALGGGATAQEGLAELARATGRSETWRMVRRMYRMSLYGAGSRPSGTGGDGPRINREEVARVWAAQGELSRAELLHCRVRYLSDGVALGSKAYVEELFEQCRDRFGAKRQSGGRALRGSGFAELYGLRDLRKQVVS